MNMSEALVWPLPTRVVTRRPVQGPAMEGRHGARRCIPHRPHRKSLDHARMFRIVATPQVRPKNRPVCVPKYRPRPLRRHVPRVKTRNVLCASCTADVDGA